MFPDSYLWYLKREIFREDVLLLCLNISVMNAKVIFQRAQDISVHSITIPSAHETSSLPEFQ